MVAETADPVARFTGALRALGLRDGGRVGMYAFNSDRYREHLLAAPWAGGVVNPINVRWGAIEVALSFVYCETNILIVDVAFVGSVGVITRRAPNVATAIDRAELPAGPPLPSFSRERRTSLDGIRLAGLRRGQLVCSGARRKHQ